MASVFVDRQGGSGSDFDLHVGPLDFNPPLKNGLVFAVNARFEGIADIAANGENTLVDNSVKYVEPFTAAIDETGSLEDGKVL